jgi:hypothetical protein
MTPILPPFADLLHSKQDDHAGPLDVDNDWVCRVKERLEGSAQRDRFFCGNQSAILTKLSLDGALLLSWAHLYFRSMTQLTRINLIRYGIVGSVRRWWTAKQIWTHRPCLSTLDEQESIDLSLKRRWRGGVVLLADDMPWIPLEEGGNADFQI